MGWNTYSDVGRVYELPAVFDDQLKRNETFIQYAILVANRIIEDLGYKAFATWGKWGARLEPKVNPHLTPADIEFIGIKIERHPNWLALKLSTQVFTYGKESNTVVEYQAKAVELAEQAKKEADEYCNNLAKKTKELTKQKIDGYAKNVNLCLDCSNGFNSVHCLTCNNFELIIKRNKK